MFISLTMSSRLHVSNLICFNTYQYVIVYFIGVLKTGGQLNEIIQLLKDQKRREMALLEQIKKLLEEKEAQ
ncbi:hypothetical protein [Candidatus Enterococcus courvalinii]|uniref:Uncharacterized protein n=1 Tax=Candidatus Enterococcus courvalinii TaxID=2815329 RepID=A0ABS3HZC4_9ENTE|nr:hypothetical protein [Enterococcus sp. MSG2901]MBO0481198.1 hypothetical protein [Enterococcus sp. MSG2901]